MQKQRLTYLLEQYGQDQATPSEMEELALYLRENGAGDLFADVLGSLMERYPANASELASFDAQHLLADKALVLDKSMDNNRRIHTPPVHRIHFLRRSIFRYAAAVVVMIGIAAAVYYIATDKKNEPLAGEQGISPDIAPGDERAMLTLADGTTITLDNAAIGAIARQGGASIVKLANGQLAYQPENLAGQSRMMNTMRTPRGGQYQLTLPDKTKVWLNAASSITFPVAFVDQERRVKVTGEAYFEIARDRSKPFILDIDGKSTVEVLGTSFNVNSYEGEAGIRTTLLEGSVKIWANEQQTVLRPGQQAIVSTTASPSGQAIRIDPDVNLEQVIAWKNGLFNFEGAGLRQVMRQLERWYDIDTKYEGQEPAIEFQGKMYRDVPLSEVLKVLQKAGVEFRMEGRTVVIL